MLSLRHVWIIVTDVANSLFGSPFLSQGLQYPIGAKFGTSRPGIEVVKTGGPIFRPPGSNIDDFWCDYSITMPGFEHCGTPEDQSCWLRNPTTGEEFNLLTDYEDINQTPKGVTRVYYLNVTDGPINANGLDFSQGKLFNGTFPGPLIGACWGDTVIIHVRNHLQYNGTSIHWHGLRQWQTMHMDGVNGLTQCPIAPGSEFMYNWTAMQYGSSWYHSHYSVQYADGLQAPITIYGPTSYPYDIAIEPITITDWANNSAFQNIAPIRGGRADTMDVLLNGTGDITRFTGGQTKNTDTIPPRFELSFDDAAPSPMTGAKRYLLRLINTSFGNSFIFAIDNHNLTVVETDFVPVHNFNTTSILVAIGQRYNIIVEATPIVNNAYMKTGVLRYDKTSTTDPTTIGWNISDTDSDKSINDQLNPVLQWSVQKPANWDNSPEVFNIVQTNGEGQYATAFVAFQRNGSTDVNPFQTTYGNPTFLNLDNVGDEWPAGWFVVPENYTDNDWIFLVIDKPKLGPHPIHLHGHDFAIIQQSDNSSFDIKKFNQNQPDVNFPRRDADNPGVWLMHCHIAGHASGGLSLQIMERHKAANGIWPPGNSDALNEAHKLCASWNSWSYDCKNLWPGNTGNSQKAEYPSCEDSTNIQNDSGV
ncbi:multicopper oxidase [Colletotrichum gloeosporioides 23]|nr:multicopper oxidase [Colletotrichum gloeosporioides 23]